MMTSEKARANSQGRARDSALFLPFRCTEEPQTGASTGTKRFKFAAILRSDGAPFGNAQYTGAKSG